MSVVCEAEVVVAGGDDVSCDVEFDFEVAAAECVFGSVVEAWSEGSSDSGAGYVWIPATDADYLASVTVGE